VPKKIIELPKVKKRPCSNADFAERKASNIITPVAHKSSAKDSSFPVFAGVSRRKIQKYDENKAPA
jgi:hypothetical protein